MKILIVGGTGVISSAVCHECINKGFELFVINRGLRKSEKMSEKETFKRCLLYFEKLL